ncbi:MAG: glycosyltransferase, partial [Bacteroidia bacterium]|nr:glycosyltransferase [Bacteroidia bacterium]
MLKISIITVCYNSADTIESTVRSVISQDHPDIEYIIVDGGSTDSTLTILDKYRSSFAKFISGKDNGIYDALNKGLALATGDIIGI